MNQLKVSVIKQEFDDNLTTPLEGWNVLSGDITTSSSSLLPSTTQSVSDQFRPTASTSSSISNTSTSRSPNVNKNYPNIASVRANPINGRQVTKFERNNNRPFITARYNKFVSIGPKLQQTPAKLPINFELLFKKTQEQLKEVTKKLVDNQNTYSILEEKYDQLKLVHLEFKTNANKSMEELKLNYDKLNDEFNQFKGHQVTLMAQMHAQTSSETSQANAHIYIKQEIDDDISTRPELLYNLIEVGQNVDSTHCPSLSNATKMQIKQEFKEEFSDDDSEHCPSLSNANEMKIKHEFSDDDSLSNQASDIMSSDQLNTNNNSVSQCIATVNENVSTSANEIDVTNNLTDESGHHELIGESVDQQTNQLFQLKLNLNDAQANVNEEMNLDNVLVDEDKGNTDLNNDEEMSNNGRSVVESNEPSTSSQQHSNLIASTLPTGSNHQNLTKRKRKSQSNCSMKRSNKTVEDEDEGEEEADIAYNNRVNDKIKMLYLDCTEQNCEIKFNSVYRFQDHLRTAHGILPYRCFALNCISRFNNCQHLGDHIKLQHSKPTKFECHACHNGFASQKEASNHWNHIHLTGQFQCKLNECYQVLDTRSKVHAHQRYKHCPESKRFQCQHDGCEASFVTKHNLKRHGMSHANTKPFNCTWTECGFHSNDRPHMVRHFGLPETLKEQAAKNIVDERDPNEYVRVVDR